MRKLALALALVLLPVLAEGAAPCATSGWPGTPYQGFGSETPGGAGQTIYHVTSLADTGAVGTLRDALRAGNRCIVFDVAGDIVLGNQIYATGSFVTLDGFTAPAPGVTIRGFGLAVWGPSTDWIIRGIRIRDSFGSGFDNIQIKNGVRRMVVDHVSTDHAGDGALDISSQVGSTLTQDITVSNSILSGTLNQSLVLRSIRVSMHGNLFIDGQNRNPQAEWDDTLATFPPEIVLDFRNNMAWNYSAYGTIVRRNAQANVIGNYYSSTLTGAWNAIVVDLQGRAYVSGSVSGQAVALDAKTTETGPFPSLPMTTTDACTAAYAVRADAGARLWGLDATDSGHLAGIPTSLPGCPLPLPLGAPTVNFRQ